MRQEPGRGDGRQRGEPPPGGLLGGAFEEPGEGEREQCVERVRPQLGAAQDELARERDDEAGEPGRPEREQPARVDDQEPGEQRACEDADPARRLDRKPGLLHDPGEPVPERRSRLRLFDAAERGTDRRLDHDPRRGDLVLPEWIADRRGNANRDGRRRREKRDDDRRAVGPGSSADSGRS